MNRRPLLVALSGALTTSLLTAVPRGGALAQTAALTRLDASEYRARTLLVGSLALQASEIANQRAVDPRVREFALFEINEQIAMAQVLTNTSDANPPPAALDAARAAILQALNAAQGRALDASYVQAQIQAHQELMAIQQGFLQPPVIYVDLEHIAVLARATIAMHLTMLRDLAASMPA